MKNILARKDKSVGVTKQICSILEDLCFGDFHFEVAIILRDSLLLNGILTNSEAWYHIREEELRILEKCDESLLRKIYEAPITTPIPFLYLESGCKPIRFIIQARRVMFLHYILNEDEGSLISRFLQAQAKNPNKDDWYLTILEDLKYLEIFLDFEQIKSASKQQFKDLVDESVEEKAYKYLVEKQKKMNKILSNEYSELKMENYLKSSDINIRSKKFIFSARSRMLDVSSNYSNTATQTFCPVCKVSSNLDNQEHLLLCQKLSTNQPVQEVLVYDDLLNGAVPKQIQIAAVLEANFRLRKKLVKNSLQTESQVNLLCSPV